VLRHIRDNTEKATGDTRLTGTHGDETLRKKAVSTTRVAKGARELGRHQERFLRQEPRGGELVL
jgi:hypothetical protein